MKSSTGIELRAGDVCEEHHDEVIDARGRCSKCEAAGPSEYYCHDCETVTGPLLLGDAAAQRNSGHRIVDDRIVKELGFADVHELAALVQPTQSERRAPEAYEKWNAEDGSKAGLLKLTEHGRFAADLVDFAQGVPGYQAFMVERGHTALVDLETEAKQRGGRK